MRRYVIEAIGTFFLVLTVCFAVLSGSALAPMGIGAVLVVMVFAGGHISGGHYSPAVTLAVWIRGALPRTDLLPYMGAQVLAGLVAAGVARIAFDAPAAALTVSGRHLIGAFLAELLFTFA